MPVCFLLIAMTELEKQLLREWTPYELERCRHSVRGETAGDA